MIINQQPKFCAIFFSKINPNLHVDMLQGSLGAIAIAFPYILKILHTRCVDSPVMMWIQIRAGGGGSELFLLKLCNLSHSTLLST